MATYNRELIEPLVAALERSTARVAELERENGRLEAENRALLASTAPQSADSTPEPFWSRSPRGWIAGVAMVLAIVAVVVLLGWPW
jgi:ferric-dicitrate binding protein FerR (iron transport regulator)